MEYLIALFLAGGLVPLAFTASAAYCCCKNCCRSGDPPTQIQLTVSGVTNGQCSRCSVYNSTWITDRSSVNCTDTPPSSDLVCFWRYSDSTTLSPCLPGEDLVDGADGSPGICVQAGTQCLTSGSPTLEGYIHMRSGGVYVPRAVIAHSKTYTVPAPVGDWSDTTPENLPDEIGSSLACNDSAATVVVEVLP